jgi:two-component system LytT family sensor kinase
MLIWGSIYLGWYWFRVNDISTPALAAKITAVKVTVLALLTYFTNYLLIPRLLYKGKYAAFFAVYLSSIFIMGVIKLAIIIEILQARTTVFADFRTRFYDNIIPLFLLVTTGAAFKLIGDYLQSQRKLVEIAKEKAETELKFLKSQINPHFLFNSLNSIYFLIDKQNSEARKTLLQFSDLLRYQLYDCNSESIAIEKEVNYLKDYIRLQELRKDNKYQVNLKVEEDVKGFNIVPLLLIPFVENAFKHISHHSREKNFVQVYLGRTNGQFIFQIENSKEAQNRSTEPPGGIGLNNVKRRLELLYPKEHQLDIHNNEQSFKVDLRLKVYTE